MLVEKWNFKKQEYEEYELPDDCPLICHDMEKNNKLCKLSRKIQIWRLLL